MEGGLIELLQYSKALYEIVMFHLFQKYESIEDEAYNKGIEKERAEGRAMTMPQGQGENEASKSLDAAEEVGWTFIYCYL